MAFFTRRGHEVPEIPCDQAENRPSCSLSSSKSSSTSSVLDLKLKDAALPLAVPVEAINVAVAPFATTEVAYDYVIDPDIGVAV